MELTVTQLLQRWSEGDKEAAEEVLPLVYEELRCIAVGYLQRERPGHTLQATAVVHEVYLQLMVQTGVRWQNHAHFIGRTAHMMRRILVDHARERNALKRGGAQQRVTLTEARVLTDGRPPDLVALDDALRGLDEVDRRKASIVEQHFFGGLTFDEIAEVQGISQKTAVREWQRARIWLYHELKAADPDEP
jgi:RNA polymerase sigma factor (TIGR02999 family)